MVISYNELKKLNFSPNFFLYQNWGQRAIFPETRSRQFYHIHLQYLRLKTYKTINCAENTSYKP